MKLSPQPINVEKDFEGLFQADPELRLKESIRKTEEFLSRQDKQSQAKALDYLKRAWILSNQNIELLPPLRDLLLSNGQLHMAKQVLIDGGLRSLECGRHEEALLLFNAAHRLLAEVSGLEWFEPNAPIYFALRILAQSYVATMPEIKREPNKLPRVLYVGRGIVEHNSILMRILRQIAKYHNRQSIDVIFCFPESERQIDASTQGRGHLDYFRDLGYQVVLGAGHQSELQNCLELAVAIRAQNADLVMFSAVCVTMYSYFLSNLSLGKKLGVFAQGDPGLFCAPHADFGIAVTKHAQIDSPFFCPYIPIEHELPSLDPEIYSLRLERLRGSKKRTIVVGGRLAKFKDAQLWQHLTRVLIENPYTSLRILGCERQQVINAFSEVVQPRVEVYPWSENYTDKLAEGDLCIDTYPSGGGIMLLEAMALKVPVVTFQNDYTIPLDQRSWNPGMELVGTSDSVLPRGDFESFHQLVCMLLNDEEYLLDLAERQYKFVKEGRGDIERFVGRCEDSMLRFIRSNSDVRPRTL